LSVPPCQTMHERATREVSVHACEVCSRRGQPQGHFRAKRDELQKFQGPLPGSQGQNLASSVLQVPCSLYGGTRTHYAANWKMRLAFSLLLVLRSHPGSRVEREVAGEEKGVGHLKERGVGHLKESVGIRAYTLYVGYCVGYLREPGGVASQSPASPPPL
jgi:hypothetical protein